MMKLIFSALVLVMAMNMQAQTDKKYFKTLQSQRVESSDLVEWTQVGPGMAGYCEEFWCHPTDANVMFMSPDMYNSYGTWDNGESWQTIKDVDGTGMNMRRVQSITFSHQDANFGLAIDVRGTLYKTTDQGKRWKPTLFKGSGKYCELAVDPNNDNNWYMGAGDFWNVKANHRTQASLNDPAQGYFYKYASYGHIYKSTNKGKSWKKVTKGLPETLDVAKIIVDPSDSKRVIMAANSGIYLSNDAGNSWKLGGQGLPNNSPRALTSYYDKENNEFVLYAVDQTSFTPEGKTITSEGGIYKSTDHGKSWVNISGNLAVNMNKMTSYGARMKYFRSVAHWLGLKNDKEAKTKYPELPEKVYSVYNRIVVNPLNKDEIYISHNTKHDKAFLPGDVWKTSDGGKTWIATARTGRYWSKGKDNAYWESRNNPTVPNTKYAHLQHEQDNREETFGNRFMEINSQGEVFICLEQQIMRSENHGESWEQIDDYETSAGTHHWVGRGGSNLPGRFILTETGDKNKYLFCSGEHGLWQSAPLGDYKDKKAVALKQIEGQVNHKGATSIASVAVHPNDPNTIYMIMFRQDHRGAFRRSTDGGKTWENLSVPLEHDSNYSMQHIFQHSLTIDPQNPNNIYFVVIKNPIAEVSGHRLPKGFSKFGVMKSNDGGYTWSPENTGMPANVCIRRIKMHPTNSSILYAASNQSLNGNTGGLYMSKNKAASWEKVKIPAQIKAVNDVFIDKTTHDIFISCGTSEGTFEEGGVWRSKNEGKSWEKVFDMPYVWQTEVSPINPDIITVSVPLQHERKGATTFNCGAYLSLDGGKTWNKINNNLGQPNQVVDLKPDPYREDVFWCALKGSGWAIGYIKGSKKGWSQK
ncbi:sialidase family protein [Labilibacter marinus]|uniref:sialidase family protein n=1 Tax=Labilibacter marinus TaxID=1477105 RepID=UPI00094F585D|nr:sialidase family protein [Labilibacter marinus]